MTIPWTGTGGLFTRIGKLGAIAVDLYTLNVTTLPADAVAVNNQYQGTGPSNPEPDLLSSFLGAVDASRNGANSITGTMTTIAAGTVERMVFRDNPQSSRTTISLNLVEMIRQMKVASQSVQVCTVGVSTGTVSGITNNGNGFTVVSTKRGDGLVQENMFAETGLLTCTADSQSSSLSAGSEQFLFRGDEAQASPWHWEWPLGSGATQSLTSVNPVLSNAGGNKLVNGGFDTFTSNTPNNWTITVGSAGTEVFAEASIVYSGAKALKLVGGTAVNTALTQQFNLAAGTSATLAPDTVYDHMLMIKADVVPAAGVLTVELIDNGGSVINDDQGNANSYTITLSGITTSYAKKSGTFRTPRVMPSTVRLRYRLSTAVSGGTNIYIDHTGFAASTALYAGGPQLTIFSGNVPWILGDTLSLTTTNDRGTASSLATFQTLFDRLFNMRSLGLLLPSSGSPTISDSLI